MQAIASILTIDNSVATQETEVLREIMGLLDANDAARLVEMVKKRENTELSNCMIKDRGLATKMLFYLCSTCIIDNKLHPNEVQMFKNLGTKLGFPIQFCNDLIVLFQKVLEVKKDCEKLYREAEGLHPFFKSA